MLNTVLSRCTSLLQSCRHLTSRCLLESSAPRVRNVSWKTQQNTPLAQKNVGLFFLQETKLCTRCIQLSWGINKPTKLRKKSSQKEWKTSKLDHLRKRRNAVGADIHLVSKVIMKL